MLFNSMVLALHDGYLLVVLTLSSPWATFKSILTVHISTGQYADPTTQFLINHSHITYILYSVYYFVVRVTAVFIDHFNGPGGAVDQICD